MLIKLTEAVEDSMSKRYILREVSINPDHVVAIREDAVLAGALAEGRLTEGLNPATRFSKLTVGASQYGMTITVVGAPDLIQEKLNNSKRLLKG